MNSNTLSLLRSKRLTVIRTIWAVILFSSCVKEKMPIPLNTATIRFEATSYTIELDATDPLTVTLPLSLPLEEEGTAIISIGNGTAANNEYTINPELSDGSLTIPLAKGATEVSFQVSSLNNFEGNKTIILNIGSATGGVSVANSNATTTITLIGKKPIVPEVISSVTSLEDFGMVEHGSQSESKSFTVAGTLLSSDITVSASDYFEVSLDNVTFQSAVQIGFEAANDTPVEVFVRFSPTTGTNQLINGTITSTVTDLASSIVNVSGTEIGNADIPGVLLLNENFEYGATGGNLTTLSGGSWTIFSGSLNPIQYSPSGLSFTGYAGSGIGGAAISENGSGSREDLTRSFEPQSSGVIYVAQLLNIGSAPAAGDFFSSFRDPSAAYFNRLYAKDIDGKLALGVGKSSATVAYSDNNYSYGNTYLVITKYDFNSGISSLFVLSNTVPVIEPAAPDATTDIGSGPASIQDVIIRQNTTNPLSTTIDGIRVASTWQTVLGL